VKSLRGFYCDQGIKMVAPD